MRFNEVFVREFMEYLDPYSHGSWFNPYTRKSIPVDSEQHYDTMKQMLSQEGIETADPIKWAFDNGWIRVRFSNPYSVNLQGKHADIAKAWKILLPQLLSLDSVHVSFSDQNDAYMSFRLPHDREAIRNFDNAKIHQIRAYQSF